MAEHSSSADNYVLGHTPFAIQRLLRLGQICHPFTRNMLVEAGLTTGMRVLDIGCGPGDVSLIAAELVGATGSVFGIDASSDMLEVAQSRVQAAGLTHVSFLATDVRTLALEESFDALIGRFILMHLPDPASVLRHLLEPRAHMTADPETPGRPALCDHRSQARSAFAAAAQVQLAPPTQKRLSSWRRGRAGAPRYPVKSCSGHNVSPVGLPPQDHEIAGFQKNATPTHKEEPHA